MTSRRGHLIGAYGMLWNRDEVNWFPGSGPQAWQMLGCVNHNKPVLRVCDFRQARGFYVLFDDFRATYTGLARGRGGIGARLRQHDKDPSKRWTRFCWFSFDDVLDVDDEWPGWCEVDPRDSLPGLGAEEVIRESEALMIAILGLQDQNEMRFAQAQRWEQLTEADFLPGGRGLKADADGYTDYGFARLAGADR